MINLEVLRRPIVGVIGPSKYTCTKKVYDFGYDLGTMLARLNVHLVCGGKDGIMESVCAGFISIKRRKGLAIGIIPDDYYSGANPFCEIVIPSGMGIARNILIVNTANVLVAVGGGAGTLSELAFAWQKNKQVICCTMFDGWAKDLSNIQLDKRRKDLFYPAASLDQIKQLLVEILDLK